MMLRTYAKDCRSGADISAWARRPPSHTSVADCLRVLAVRLRRTRCDSHRAFAKPLAESLADHDGREVRVRAWHRGHDARVGDDETLDAAHPPAPIDGGSRVPVAAHGHGAARVIPRPARFPDP